MAEYWLFMGIFLGLFLLILLISVGVGYAIASRTFGHEVAQKNLRTVLPLFFISFLGGTAIAFVLPLLGKYGRLGYNILFAVFFITYPLTYPLSWLWRRKKAGSLVLDLGRLSSSKLIFWFGVFQAVVAAFLSFSLLQLVLRGAQNFRTPDAYFSLVLSSLSTVIPGWSVAILFCSMGLSRLQLRENGICYMFTRMGWQRITSYTWERAKPNVLTIRFKPRFPLIPGFWSLPLSIARKDDVEHILAEYLPSKSET
jgi:hypothetical protein